MDFSHITQNIAKTRRSMINDWVNQTLFGDWGNKKHVDPKDPRGKESNKSMKKPRGYKLGFKYYWKSEVKEKVEPDAESV